jgi:hypothetical protein
MEPPRVRFWHESGMAVFREMRSESGRSMGASGQRGSPPVFAIDRTKPGKQAAPRPALALRRAALRERCQKRLSFGDLRHFRRRRKAFQRRREHVVRFDRAAGIFLGRSEKEPLGR